MSEASMALVGCSDCELAFQCPQIPDVVEQLADEANIPVSKKVGDQYIRAKPNSGLCTGAECPKPVTLLQDLVKLEGIPTTTRAEQTLDRGLRIYSNPRISSPYFW
jgi:hypothetical protein